MNSIPLSNFYRIICVCMCATATIYVVQTYILAHRAKRGVDNLAYNSHVCLFVCLFTSSTTGYKFFAECDYRQRELGELCIDNSFFVEYLPSSTWKREVAVTASSDGECSPWRSAKPVYTECCRSPRVAHSTKRLALGTLNLFSVVLVACNGQSVSYQTCMHIWLKVNDDYVEPIYPHPLFLPVYTMHAYLCKYQI